MTTWLNRLAVAALALATLNLTSCKKDEVRATLTPSNAPTLTSNATSVTLLQSTGTQTAMTITWTPVKSLVLSEADKSTNATVAYYLQIDKKGNNFAAPVSVAAGDPSASGTTTSELKGSDLNSALNKLGLKPGVATDVEMRISASYAPNANIASAALPLKATTYECIQPAAANAWSLIGTVGPGADWSTDYVMTYDCATNAFVYTGALKVGVYKFRYGGSWTANLGGASSTGGTLTQDGPNLSISAARTYTITLLPGTIGTDGKVSGGTFTIK